MTIKCISIAVLSAAMMACASTPTDPARSTIDPASSSRVEANGGSARISGLVVHAHTQQPIPDGLLVLHCACLAAPLELQTDAQGAYRFEGLPPGTYEVRLFVGTASETRSTELAEHDDAWVGFAADPGDESYCLEPSVQPRTSYCPY